MPPPAPPSPVDGGWAGASSVSTEGEYHRHPAPGDEKYDFAELRGRPYGLGPRVPLYVISPWSRGGWVDSQVYDHTSVIRLIERRFGVSAPDISPWRRAVCGDLSTAFDFAQRDTRPFVRGLPDVSAVAHAPLLCRAHRARAARGLKPAKQESGVRPARALPYRPQASIAAVDVAALTWRCPARAQRQCCMSDRLRLEAVPRRYTLLPGMPLRERWPLDAQGRCDLWLLGPNGFHRHFQGAAKAPAVQASIDRADGQLRLHLRNLVTVHSRCACMAAPMQDTCPNRHWRCPHMRRLHWRGMQRLPPAGMTCASARVGVCCVWPAAPRMVAPAPVTQRWAPNRCGSSTIEESLCAEPMLGSFRRSHCPEAAERGLGSQRRPVDSGLLQPRPAVLHRVASSCTVPFGRITVSSVFMSPIHASGVTSHST